MSFESGLSGLGSKLRQQVFRLTGIGIARQFAQMIDNLVGREEEEKIFSFEARALKGKKQ